MYNPHLILKEPTDSSYWRLVDYLMDEEQETLWLLAEEGTKDSNHFYRELIREFQLTLDLSGCLDAPLP